MITGQQTRAFLQNPKFFGTSILLLLLAAYAAAGATSVTLALGILSIVWLILILEISYSKLTSHTGLYRPSIILLGGFVCGMFLILVASDIAKRNAEIPSASAIAEEVAKRLPNNQNHGFMQNAGDPLFGVPRLIAGKPIPINIGVYNGGGDPIYNVNTLFLAILAPIKDVKFDPDKETYSWFVKDSEVHAQKLEKAHSDGNAAPPKYEIWTTLQVGPLADGDIDKILRGEMRLYLLSWARWKDEPQDYVNCVWMQPPATTKLSDLVWHICSH